MKEYLDRNIVLESINDLYDEPLSEEELKEASQNLIDFFNILIEADLDNKAKNK